MTTGHGAIAAVLAASVLAPAAAGAELPEPSLQLARRLTLPAEGQPVDETERALLRVEWKAAQSGAEEAAVVNNMLLRLDQMGSSVTQLRRQLSGAPAPLRRLPDPVPMSAPLPDVQEPATAGSGYWLPAIGTVVVLIMLSALWLRRRRIAPRETTFEPLPATETAAMPSILLKQPGTTLAPPTISNGQDAADDLPPAEPDQPPAPPGDDQIPLELADILVSLGLVDGAVKTLEDHIRQHPGRALCHWLKLLDVYRRSGMQQEFETAARALNQRFNIAPADWQPPAATAPGITLEYYPHIRARLQTLWRRRGCADYLRQLLEDNRAGTRTGFPQSVVEEILFLQGVLRG